LVVEAWTRRRRVATQTAKEKVGPSRGIVFCARTSRVIAAMFSTAERQRWEALQLGPKMEERVVG